MQSLLRFLLLILFLSITAQSAAKAQSFLAVPSNLKPQQQPDIGTLMTPEFLAEVNKRKKASKIQLTASLLITSDQPSNLLKM